MTTFATRTADDSVAQLCECGRGEMLQGNGTPDCCALCLVDDVASACDTCGRLPDDDAAQCEDC